MKKLAIITGASSGIGQQIALDLAKQDYKCLLLGRNITKLKNTETKCYQSESYMLDLTSEKQILTTTTEIVKVYLHSDFEHIVLINNAGIVERNSFVNTSIDSWKHQFQTNLFGPVLFTQKLLELLKSRTSSKIINISSTLGVKPITDTSAYSATKAAMNNWTQSLALELAKFNIQVNAICPGIIETPLQDFYQTQDKTLRQNLNSLQPLGRIGQSSDISAAVQFLADPNTSWLTGTIIPVDGGILLG